MFAYFSDTFPNIFTNTNFNFFISTVELPPVEDDPIVPFRVFRLQEPEDPINNATSRGLRREPPAGAGGLQVAGFRASAN